MNKKKLLKTLGVVALIGAVGIGSTFAYLTSTSNTVTNTFTVGNVNFDEEMNNGIMESGVTRDPVGDDNSNNYKDADGLNTWTEVKNTYEDLVAYETVFKDPTIFMGEDSVDARLFVRVYNAENEAFDGDAYEIADGVFASILLNSGWSEIGRAADDSYVDYVYFEAVKGGQHYTLFTEVAMGNLTADSEIPEIEIKASAVQFAGLTQEEAYDEVKTLMD